jgi:TonB family protein
VGLIGNSSELTLTDLVQMKAMSRGTCRILVQGSQGPGVLYISDGSVIHAEYAGRVGIPAASALLAEERVEYRATSDVATPAPTMQMDASTLILQTAVQVDEDRRVTGPARAARQAPGRDPARDAPRSRKRIVRAVGGVLVAAVVAIVAFARVTVGPSEAVANPTAAPPAPVPEALARAAVEANRLTGARDALPVLLSGELPRTPSPEVALRPTVIVRILVDESGAVARAEVYQPRAELAGFEQAALAAARGFKFRAARREGQLVASWINWPVDFL